ncbi:hypothetical protein LTR74_004468 [Friedmanniomyces endolithicus]|nr:hypothetical protein LTR74_004468 [Friedmanniomyces endolithicus]
MASNVSSGKRNHYDQAEIHAAEALLELGQPVHHTQESLTSAAQALLALGQPVDHAPQHLGSTASISSSRPHQHDASPNPRATASLPLYNPPGPITNQNLDHQAAEAVFALNPPPPRAHSYTLADKRAAEALLALNREDTQAAEASLAIIPTQFRHNLHKQVDSQAAEVLPGRDPGTAGESVDAEGGQVRARRVEVVGDRYVGSRWAEASERRDSANDGTLAGGRVRARGLESEGNQQEERARDERSLWFE